MEKERTGGAWERCRNERNETCPCLAYLFTSW